MRSTRFGLGAWLAFAFAALSVLAMAVLLAVVERTATAQVRASIGASLIELSAQTSSRLDRSMHERYREVRLLAQRLAPVTDPAAMRRQLDQLQASYPHYAWLGVTDLQGRVLTAAGGLLAGADVAARPWFRGALAGEHVKDVHEAQLLAKLLADASGEAPRFVDVAFPLPGPDGQPRGVLGAHLHWRWANEIEAAIFSSVERHRDVDPLIVSSAGAVLLGPAALRDQTLDTESLRAARAGRSGYSIERWPDGRDYLVGYSPTQGYLDYPGLGWTVLVRQDLQAAFEPVAELRRQMLAWGLGLALVFCLIGVLLARGITRPLLALASDASALAGGQLERVAPTGVYREVATLGDALNTLVARLREQSVSLRGLNAELEQRVQARTAELESAFERVRQSEQRMRTIIESAQDPFIAVDLDGRIVDWNSQAETLFGWSRAEISGRSFARTLVSESQASGVEAALMAYLADGDAAFMRSATQLRLVDRNGREIPVALRAGLVEAGGQRFFSAFLHDMTQQLEADRQKSEFVSTAVHELRTPLTAIHGSLSLLNAGMVGPLPDDALELLRVASEACDRLVALAGAVLDAEQFDSGRVALQLEHQPLLPLVEQAVQQAAAKAPGSAMPVLDTRTPHAEARVDGARLVQALSALLANAISFSPPGEPVQVTLDAGPETLVICVIDRGPGVPAAFLPRLFQRFAQADGSDRRTRGGTGLGLSLARSIIEAHGGQIRYERRDGRLTVFGVVLPRGCA